MQSASVKFSTMSTPQLVAFYNRHSTKPVKRFADRRTAERRCAELFRSLAAEEPGSPRVIAQRADPAAPRLAMRTTLKLDRRIACLETGETWPNAHRMWRERPDWMTSSQQDRLTAQLYAAAKAGTPRAVVINGRSFALVSPGAAPTTAEAA